MKKNYMNEFGSLQQLLPLGEPNKLSETKHESWHVITQWPGHLFHQWRTQFCHVLDRGESLLGEVERVYNFEDCTQILSLYNV